MYCSESLHWDIKNSAFVKGKRKHLPSVPRTGNSFFAVSLLLAGLFLCFPMKQILFALGQAMESNRQVFGKIGDMALRPQKRSQDVEGSAHMISCWYGNNP